MPSRFRQLTNPRIAKCGGLFLTKSYKSLIKVLYKIKSPSVLPGLSMFISNQGRKQLPLYRLQSRLKGLHQP